MINAKLMNIELIEAFLCNINFSVVASNMEYVAVRLSGYHHDIYRFNIQFINQR